MVNDDYPVFNGYFIGNINPTFSDKPTYPSSKNPPGTAQLPGFKNPAPRDALAIRGRLLDVTLQLPKSRAVPMGFEWDLNGI